MKPIGESEGGRRTEEPKNEPKPRTAYDRFKDYFHIW
jgi:hypothetical protein